MVYRILNRLVETVGSLVKGEARALVDAQEIAAKARLSELETQQRLKLSTGLIRLEERLGAGSNPKELLGHVRSLLAEVSPMPAALTGPPAHPPDGAEQLDSGPAPEPAAGGKDAPAPAGSAGSAGGGA